MYVSSNVLATRKRHCPVLAIYSTQLFYPFLAMFLWPPYVIGADIVFLPCGFYLLSIFFFIPRLISAAAGWMSTIL